MEYFLARTIPPPNTGTESIEFILNEYFQYDFSRRGVRIPAGLSAEDNTYMKQLLKIRRSRLGELRRKEKMQDEDYKRRRNAWFAQRHKRRREEAILSLERLAWFNTTFLFANLKRRGLTCELSREEIEDLSQRPCYYCKDTWSGGVDRLDSNTAYIADNVVSSCKTCNYMKNKYTVSVFKSACIDVYNYKTSGKRSTDGGKRGKIKKTFAQWKSSTRHDVLITEDQYYNIINQQCSYCGLEESRGVDRMDNAVAYTLENCTPCCGVCNQLKWTNTVEFFHSQVERICIASEGFKAEPGQNDVQ